MKNAVLLVTLSFFFAFPSFGFAAGFMDEMPTKDTARSSYQTLP